MKVQSYLATGILAGALIFGSAAMAQQNNQGNQGNTESPGTTSGPAAGGNVVPGGAAQRSHTKGHSRRHHGGSAQSLGLSSGAVAHGAPGVAGKPGAEAEPGTTSPPGSQNPHQ